MVFKENLYISKAGLNCLLIFGVLPFFLYAGFSVASYLLFVLYLFVLERVRARNVLIFLLVSLLSYIFVVHGPLYSQFSSEVLASAINTTFAFFLLLLSPWLKMNIVSKENIYTDLLIVIFLSVSLVLQIPGVKAEAALQIGSFTFALYFAVSQNIFRKLFLISGVVIGGGRMILAGAVYGLVMFRWPKTHKILSLNLLILASVLTASGILFAYLNDYLVSLRDQGIYLKGRTGFWLSLLESNATLFGNGAGTSLQKITSLMNFNQLPHNDYLRIYVDYGLILFIAFLYSLWRNSLNGPHQLFATSVLAAFMLTGNPLSFPTVIVSYLLVLSCHPMKGAKRLL